MQNEFLESYRNCMSRMDLKSVHPWTEHEVQESYSRIWYDNVIVPMLKLDEFQPLNPSILRSMLVMDLIDCHFLGEDKKPVFDWYVKQLSRYYSLDMFSRRVNRPNRSFKIALSDFTFFDSGRFPMQKLMLTLYQLCYSKFQDIFADNGYEVTGPYYTGTHTFVVTTFRNILPKEIRFVQYSKGILSGTVDMFGHSDLALTACVLEVDGDIVVDADEINILDQTCIQLFKPTDVIHGHLDSRLQRVESFADTWTLKEFLLPAFNKTRDRILDIDDLMEFVDVDKKRAIRRNNPKN